MSKVSTRAIQREDFLNYVVEYNNTKGYWGGYAWLGGNNMSDIQAAAAEFNKKNPDKPVYFSTTDKQDQDDFDFLVNTYDNTGYDTNVTVDDIQQFLKNKKLYNEMEKLDQKG